MRKVTNRPKAGILRAKWLQKIKEEDFKISTKFKKQYIKGYNNIVIIKILPYKQIVYTYRAIVEVVETKT